MLQIFLSFADFFLPGVSQKHFKALNCVELKDGSRYLYDETSVDCDSDSYESFRSILAIFMAIYQAMPLFFVALLYPLRKKLNPDIPDESRKLEHRDNDLSLKSVEFLFHDYHCNRWWFEIAE